MYSEMYELCFYKTKQKQPHCIFTKGKGAKWIMCFLLQVNRRNALSIMLVNQSQPIFASAGP